MRRNLSMLSFLIILTVCLLCGCSEPPQTEWDTTTELSMPRTLRLGDGADSGPSVYEYNQEDGLFRLNNASSENAAVTLQKETVSALNFNRSFADGTTAYYEFTVQITDIVESPWNALYFGFRLDKASADATTQSGIWIAIQRDRIGMRTGAWPETTYMDVPDGIDFSKERRMYIEDDMDTDTITVSAENDSGEKTALASVKIENGRINLYAPGSDTPAISDTIADSIEEAGYFNIWLHHMQDNAYLSDIKISGLEYENNMEVANMMNSKDVFADTWVSTDDEGRFTGTGNNTVNDRKVGIFYFLWHDGTSSQPIYDHTKAYYEGGSSKLIEMIQQGPLGFAHYWAEPYFGYYRSDDEWVIRKHTYQLTAAGIDFIFIDATNGQTYESTYETILKVWSKMREEGYRTPQIMFHCGNEVGLSRSSLMALWSNLYSRGRYEELWFKYDGKPLIFAPEEMYQELPEEIRSFFTFRRSWAYTGSEWYTKSDGKNAWPWADLYPQKPGKSPEGDVEQMIVMSGFWVNGSFGTNAGRSYHDGKQPANATDSDFGFSLYESGSSGKGYAFEEQFDYAIEQDPGLIMLIGWNEWWAGRWEAGAAVGQTIANTYTVTDNNEWTRHYYVDAFNPEFSRDIEPVKGLYNDNYYYQMAQNIRQYKGSRNVQTAFGQKGIDLNGSVGQWYAVGPEYRDYTGDTAHRDAESYVGQLHYTNETGRNDFAVCKVSKTEKYVYFYAECADKITEPSGTNWMNLFIDSDCDRSTGWYGYDYVLNRTQSGSTCSVMRFVNNSWEMEEIGRAEYVVKDNYIQIKVSASLIGVVSTFDFKWADNSVDSGDIMQFIDLGDTAPNDRFNYRYTTSKMKIRIPNALSKDMIVLKAGSYNAFVQREMVMLDSSNTKAVFMGDGQRLLVPKAFAEKTMGLDVSGETEFNHYGIKYVDISAALEASGRTVTRTDSMLVIASEPVSEEALLTLYRALY